MRSIRKRSFKRAILSGALASLVSLLLASPAWAAPILRIDSMSSTTAQPGGVLRYRVQITNLGDEDTVGPLVAHATLPAGLGVTEPETATIALEGFSSAFPCAAPDGSPLAGGETEIKCEFPEPVISPKNGGGPGTLLQLKLTAAVDPLASLGQTLTARFAVEGGGAASPASTVDPVRITAAPPGYGIDAFDGLAAKEDGGAFSQAGGHPDSLTTHIDFNTYTDPLPLRGDAYPVEATRDVVVNLPEGFVGNPTIAAQCDLGQLSNGELTEPRPLCPSSSQVGTIVVRIDGQISGSGHAPAPERGPFADHFGPLPLFNMVPPPGSSARFGFNILGNPVVLDASLRPDYRLAITSPKINQYLAVNGSTVTFWGMPSSPSHTLERACPGGTPPSFSGGPACPSGAPEKPFFRMPTSCNDGMRWDAHVDSWDHVARLDSRGEPDLSDPNWKSASYTSHEPPGYPASPLDPTTPWGPQVGVEGCDAVPVKGKLSATPSSIDTETSSGLAVHVEIPNPGLDNPTGVASSDIKGVKVALPRGVTINPSQAEGLGVCSLSQYEATNLVFHPSEAKGCPSDSKIGTLKLKTPLLEEELEGQVFIAKQFDNPFNSLLAIYLVIESPQRGILIKLAGKVETDEQTGQIITTFEDLPQLPFESFDFKFREGARAPLVTPPTCGTYTTETTFTPWSDPSHQITRLSDFQIVRGIGGGPCPNGAPSFKPGFQAGSENNNAGSYSPFYMRLTRSDGEQDMTRFSAVLPPGVLGKLAGLSRCPEAAIATAKAKSGLQERANPSCPANSHIGHTLVGAGVGSVLTYIPGELYLGGPFHGDPLSVIAITPAVAGPFDVGTVVVHEALTLNPKTAEVEVDGAASDPIPHILKGIPAKVRDLRIYVDRPEFTLNPTSCDPSATEATLFGSALDVFNPADDVPVSLSARYQAANCERLGFKPRLALRLKGGTKRGGHPGLLATYAPRRGDANLEGLVVRLPRSAFLEQAHIRTICTRVQFAAKSCPKGSVYGQIKAFTPLLDEPLQGPAYLRSSNHKLPDLVFDLHGLVDVEVSTRIDSVNGGIRTRVEDAPDAPITKVLLRMQGQKKGLIVNSRSLCGARSRAAVEFEGQNGKAWDAKPVLKPDCSGKRKHKRHRG